MFKHSKRLYYYYINVFLCGAHLRHNMNVSFCIHTWLVRGNVRPEWLYTDSSDMSRLSATTSTWGTHCTDLCSLDTVCFLCNSVRRGVFDRHRTCNFVFVRLAHTRCLTRTRTPYSVPRSYNA